MKFLGPWADLSQDHLMGRAQVGSGCRFGFFLAGGLLSGPRQDSRWQQEGVEFEGSPTGWASDGLPGFEVDFR